MGLRERRGFFWDDPASVVQRHKWWGLVPLVACATAGVVLAASANSSSIRPGRIAREIAERERELSAINEAIVAFRTRHQGQLPDERSDYRRQRDSLRLELDESRTRITVLEQKVVRLEERLAELRERQLLDPASPLARRQRLERELASLRAEGKTDRHPDVKIARAELAAVQAGGATPPTREEQELELRIFATREAVRGLRKGAERTEAEVETIERRIQAAGGLALEYNQLVRSARVIEGELVRMSQEGALVAVGSAPNADAGSAGGVGVAGRQLLYALSGTMLGLLAGGALLLLRELADARIHSARELRGMLNVPVLGTIPISGELGAGFGGPRPIQEAGRGARIVRAGRELWSRLLAQGVRWRAGERIEAQGEPRV